MAAKGTIAKQNVMKKIQEAFGEDFIGEVDKKIYVWGLENGERVQIALAMTCPKTPVATGETVTVVTGSRLDFEAPTTVPVVNRVATAEITSEERETVAAMMARLGL